MITKEDVKRICELSKLTMSEEQLAGMLADMENIVAFADTINAVEIDEEGLPPFQTIQNAFRPDTVLPSFPPQEILKNAGGGENGFFAVNRRN